MSESETPFLHVGIASKEHVSHATHHALAAAYAALPFPVYEDLEPVGGLVLARNLIAGRFREGVTRDGVLLARLPTHLLLVDDDVAGFTAEDIARGVASGADVVGGPLPSRQIEIPRLVAAFRRGVPTERLHHYLSPLLMRFLPDGRLPREGALLEVEAVSTGFLLLSRAAVEKVSEAAEAAGLPLTLQGKRIAPIFDFARDAAGEWIGEDTAFCFHWRRLGGRVFADMGTSLIHLGQQAFSAEPLATQLESFSPRASSGFGGSPR